MHTGPPTATGTRPRARADPHTLQIVACFLQPDETRSFWLCAVVHCTPPDPQSEEPGRVFQTLAHVNVGKDVLSVSVVVTSDDGRLVKSLSTWTERVAAIMHSVGLPNERTIELRFYELCGAINVFELIALSLRSQPSRGGTSSTPLLRP